MSGFAGTQDDEVDSHGPGRRHSFGVRAAFLADRRSPPDERRLCGRVDRVATGELAGQRRVARQQVEIVGIGELAAPAERVADTWPQQDTRPTAIPTGL